MDHPYEEFCQDLGWSREHFAATLQEGVADVDEDGLAERGLTAHGLLAYCREALGSAYRKELAYPGLSDDRRAELEQRLADIREEVEGGNRD